MAYSTPISSDIQSTGQNGGTTDAIDTTGADILFIAVSEFTGGTHTTPTDSKGNTWTELTTVVQANVQATLWYCRGGTVGSGHTVTYSGSDSYSTICFWGHSGSAATPADQQNGAATSAATSAQPGSVTPTEGSELVVALYGTSGTQGSNFSVNGGFTVIQSFNYSGVATMGLCAAYLIQTSAAAANPTGSVTNSVDWAAKIATFKAAGGGGGGTAVPRFMANYRRRRVFA